MKGLVHRTEGLWALVRTFITYIYVLLALLISGPFFIAYVAITHDLKLLYKWVRTLIRFMLRILGIRVRVSGSEFIPSPPVMFVANHQSQLDPPIVLMLLPYDVRIFPKKELFKVPILGRLMRMAGFIPVDRQHPERARKDVTTAVSHLQEGISYLIFPEGTRTRTGKVQRFKKGGFILAIDAQVPIVPIAVSGAYELNPKGTWRITSGEVNIRFLEPISTKGMGFDDRGSLAESTRQKILEVLPPQYHPTED